MRRANQAEVTPVTPGVHSCLRVPADLAVITFVRSAIAAVLAREEWPADGAARMLLASSEAVTNAIEHGSPLDGAVEVELIVTAHRAQVRVVDQGRPGAPCPVIPEVAPPPTQPRGRGLLIISRLADDVELRSAGVGTQISAGFLRANAADAERQPIRRAA
ncbi:MAG TPA: ATP-binding protein [Miltoncostaeaceae bacterium]|jgi:anti-sigma regulatory factor (Ser/Thr protein kinase)|nr:ATP-binding protein [Miltoncostaeaceae bacterium]